MKLFTPRRIRLVATILTLFVTAGVACCADNVKAEIIFDKVILSENAYCIAVRLSGFDGQAGKLAVERLDREGKAMGTESYAPAAKLELAFPYSEELDAAAICWVKDDGALLCDPVTLSFDKIYAADWLALAAATHRMDALYGGKVKVEDGSREYASGRLIVKVKEELPDVSTFDVAMTVIDDENHCFLQFETSGEAKKCAEYLKQQPGIEYVDIDSVVTVS